MVQYDIVEIPYNITYDGKVYSGVKRIKSTDRVPLRTSSSEWTKYFGWEVTSGNYPMIQIRFMRQMSGTSLYGSDLIEGENGSIYGLNGSSYIRPQGTVGPVSHVQNGGVDYRHEVLIVKGSDSSVGGSTTCSYYGGVAQGDTAWTYTAPETSGSYAFKNFAGASGFSVSGRSITIPYSAGDVSVSANYSPMYTVRFNDGYGGGGRYLQEKIILGTNARLTGNTFSRYGYDFVGWSKSSASPESSFNDASFADDVYSSASASPGAVIDLYAVWEAKSTNVLLNQPNATSIGTVSVVAKYDSQLQQVLTPTRSGYTFDGYYSGENGAGVKYYNSDGTGSRAWDRTDSECVLYANWIRNMHRVTVVNTDPSHCTLSVVCAEPSMSASESSGTLSFDAAEYSTYVITATYGTAFECKKYQLSSLDDGDGNSYAMSQSSPTTRKLSYQGSPSAPTSFTTNYTVSGQFDVSTIVQCRIGPQPLISLSPAKDSAEGWFKQNLTIGISYAGNQAVEFDGWSVTRNGSATPYDSYNPADPEPMVFTIDANCTLRVSFSVKTCNASVDVEAASKAVVGSSAASVSVDQYQAGQTHWGDVATYTARTTGLPSGIQFDGWYKADGTPADDSTVDGDAYTFRDAEYKVSLAGDLKLYAAYRASVTLRTEAMPGSLAHGKVGISGVFSDAVRTDYIRLGQKAQIAVTTDSFFGGWFQGLTPSYTTDIPLAYSQEDEITVAGVTALTVFLLDEEEFNYVALYNFDFREGHETWDESLGAWSLAGDASGIEEVSKAQYEAAMAEYMGHSYSAPSNGVFFRVNGIRRASFRVSSTGSLGFTQVNRYHVDDLTEILAVDHENVVSAVVNDHYVFVAEWGTPARRTITASLANGTERTFGDISIEGGAEQPDGSWSGQFEQNVYVKVSAVPRNGYKFVGWFRTAEHSGAPESAEREFQLKVQSDLALYAYFIQDANAIYEWEGGGASKRMTWKSKMFVSSLPFNPSAARVDSLGYPVELEVGVFSSPDATARKSSVISLKSQSPRRLSLMRPERYAQVTVRADVEVDRIVVGTSMAGLNV